MVFHHPPCQTCQETLHNKEPATARGTAEGTHSTGLKESRQTRKSISFGPDPRSSRAADPIAVPYHPLDAQGAACSEDHTSGPHVQDSLSPSPHDARSPSPAESTSNCSGETAVGSDGSPVASPREGSSLGTSGLAPEGDRIAARPNGSVAQFGRPPSLDDRLSMHSRLSMQGEIKNLVAIDMQDSERYERGYTYALCHYGSNQSIIAPGLATSLACPLLQEKGWSVFVHPEGTRYFYYNDPDSRFPVITEAWIYDTEIFAQVKHYMKAIFEFMERNNVDFSISKGPGVSEQINPPEERWRYFQEDAPIVLVLDARRSGNFGYYFVHHPLRRLVWLDEYDFTWCVGEVHIEHTFSSIAHEMMSQYWKHVECFPHLYEFTQTDLKSMSDTIGFTFGDVLTSDTSAVNMYGLEDLKHAQEIIVRHGQRTPSERGDYVGERRTICRVIGDLYHERFLNLHGERGVRLDSKQSIHYSQHRRKKLVRRADMDGSNENCPWYQQFLPSFFFSKGADDGDEMIRVDADPEPSPMAVDRHSSSIFMYMATIAMFGGPLVHANRLREISLDQIVNKKLLVRYTGKMVAEWRDVALYGTVLLSANVSFLAIQSVDEGSKGQEPKTPSQRASYFSILASLGTIISSLVLLILVRHREVMGNELIKVRSQSRWGLEALALMYGTPFSLVIWAFLGFFVSFAILWFESHDRMVIGIVVTCLAFFAIFLGWAVSASYFRDEPYEKAAGKVRSGTVDAAGKVVDAGATMGRSTLDMARAVRKGSLHVVEGAKRRFSSLASPTTSRRRRTLSQHELPQYTSQLSSEPLGELSNQIEKSGPRRRGSVGSQTV